MLYTHWQNQSALPNVNKNEMCLHVFIRSFTKGIYIVKKWEGVWHGVDVDQSWIPSNSGCFYLFSASVSAAAAGIETMLKRIQRFEIFW